VCVCVCVCVIFNSIYLLLIFHEIVKYNVINVFGMLYF